MNRTTVFKITIILLSILIVALTCGAFAIMLSFVPDGAIASAMPSTLPDDGLVGVNLLSNSYYTEFDISQFDFTTGNFSYSLLDDSYQFISSSALGVCKFAQSVEIPIGTYTFSFCLALDSGTISFINSTLFDPILIQTVSGFSVYTVTFSTSSPLSSFELNITCVSNVSFRLKWIKLESGSSFTGYYLSDGFDSAFNQGYNQGIYEGGKLLDFTKNYLTVQNVPTSNVYLNMKVNPVPVLYSQMTHWIRPGQWYSYYDYFTRYTTDGSSFAANDVLTVGWHLEKTSNDNEFIAYLRCFGINVYSLNIEYEVSGDDYIYKRFYNQTWLVSSTLTNNVYNYKIGSSEYYVFLNKESAINMQYGDSGWFTWLANNTTFDFQQPVGNLDYKNGYSNGFVDGEDSGFAKGEEFGFNSGYSEGSSVGYNTGYNAGYNAGAVEGANYSFMTLLGAVFDAPISAFRGLLNFEVLGINMSAFVTAMLSLCVVFVLLKLILR